MSRTLSWRRILAIPAALSLALGSALIASAPAHAAPADLFVTSPTDGQQLESRTVVFEGTGTEGSTITVVDSLGAALPGTTPVIVTDGAWTTTATFDADAAVEQSASVLQTTADELDGTAPVTFQLPEAVVPTAFEITNPTDGATLDSRTVIIDGTGTDGSTVVLLDADGVAVPGTTAVTVEDGAWTATATYPDDAEVPQSVTATQFTAEEEDGQDTVTFDLPATEEPGEEPGEDAEFAITSPLDGDELESRTVVFTGTGADGSTVDLYDIEEQLLPGGESIGIVDGTWTATVTFAETADAVQLVFAEQTTDDELTGEASVVFALPFAFDPPVITSPTTGETVVGDQVTFEGTGEPGANVVLLVVPTALIDELLAELEGDGSEQRIAADAAAEPADPEDPIVIDENGEWTVTLALVPEDYTAVAVLIDPVTGFPTSEPSAFTEFSLVAAAPVTNPGANGPGEGLAVTGSESTGPLGLAVALLLAGGLMLVVRSWSARATQD